MSHIQPVTKTQALFKIVPITSEQAANVNFNFTCETYKLFKDG